VRNRTAFGLIMLLTGISAGAPQAQAGLRICNQGNIKYRTAVGYVDRQKGWVARGWMSLEPGECKDALSFRLDNRYYYYYAVGREENSHIKITGDNAFCIESRKFKIYQADYGKSTPDDCAKDGLRSEKFKKVDVQGKPEFTINLGGPDQPAPGGEPTPAPPQSPVANVPPPPPRQPPVVQQPPPAVQPPVASTEESEQRPRRPRTQPSPNGPPDQPAVQGGNQGGGTACQRFPNLC
jgi:uncharacterized membrane protein